MKQRLAIVLNPDSGKNETSKSEIKKLFGDYNVTLEFFDIKKGIDTLADQIAKHKPQAVVAVGGDGTVNAVANIVTKLALPMGVIPAGTLNHFAKDMGLPIDPIQAAAVIAKQRIAKIDYATINDRAFVNNCNLGGYPETVMQRDKSSLPSKWLAGVIAAVKVWNQHKRQNFALEVDDNKMRVRAGSLFIGNNSYQLEGVQFTARPKLDQGRLQLVVIKTGRLRHLVSILISFITKRAHEKVDIHHAKELTIRSAKTHYNVAIDGEVAKFDMPLSIKIHSKALSVLV